MTIGVDFGNPQSLPATKEIPIFEDRIRLSDLCPDLCLYEP